MMIDGGISSPSVPAPASDPTAISSGYLRRESSGNVILPIVAQVAADEPDTAAKIVQPMMFVCSSRPGSHCSHGARPRNRPSESRVFSRISPIHTNSGSAVSVQLDSDPHTVSARASPPGRVVKSSMPSQATPSTAMPIQTPAPRITKSATISKSAIRVPIGSLDVRGFVGARRQLAGPQRYQQLLGEGERKAKEANRHRQLRNPQRRRV